MNWTLTLTIALATSSLFIAALTTWVAYRLRKGIDARSQAGLVFVHFEETPTGRSSWVIENRGKSKIFDVRLQISDSRVSFESLSPGVQRVTLDNPLIRDAETVDAILSFKDEEGNRWKANNSGFEEEGERDLHTNPFPSLTSSAVTAIASMVVAAASALAALISSIMR
ncbi:hypothetical protein AB0D30_26045 [Streptomyces sp. NPDC048409]|uniref:hypothetical protein n=1 Tax=Streptomyces sp. NPDC048409 TaxID=3154723 RepID=UPI00342BCB67